MQANVQAFLDQTTETWTYIVFDKIGGTAAIIDPVLDFDYASGNISPDKLQPLIQFLEENQLQAPWVIETHAHADHLSAAMVLHQRLGCNIATGANVTVLQQHFSQFYNLKAFKTDGSQFARLLKDGDVMSIGELQVQVIATPGHTPACISLKIGDKVFVGDTLFAPDLGTARCDFPGGDARVLYQSIEKLLALPEQTELYLCHDYPNGQRQHRCFATVKEQKQENIHVGGGKTEQEFVALREARDKTLAMPRLILPSIQVNIRAGAMPDAEDNGTVYLKVPIQSVD